MMKKLGLVFTLLISSLVVADTLMIEVTVNHGVHDVVRIWTVAGDFSDRPHESDADALVVHLWQGDQQIRHYRVANPSSVHSPLLETGEEAEHEEIPLNQSMYHLRIPAQHGITHVTVESETGHENTSRSINRSVVEPVLTIEIPK